MYRVRSEGLLDFEFDGLRKELTRGVGDSKGKSGGLLQFQVDTAGMGWPHLGNRGIQGDGFCVGHVVAKLGGLTGMDGGWREVEPPDCQFRAT